MRRRSQIKTVEPAKKFEWQQDGEKSFDSLKCSFLRFSRSLHPYGNKREILQWMNQVYYEIMQMERSKHVPFRMSREILFKVFPGRRIVQNKSKLIEQKRLCMFEMRNRLQTERPQLIRDARAFRCMEKSLHYSFRKSVPIEILKVIRSELHSINQSKELIVGIQANVTRCEFMTVCEDRLHTRPSGCPKCGVIFLGRGTNQAIYTKSNNRRTGMEELVPVAFEIKSLKDDQAELEKNIAESEARLNKSRSAAYMKVLIALQNWISCHLARRRADQREALLETSAFYFRIRKLVIMKKAVDAINTVSYAPYKNDLETTFSEYIKELREYVSYKEDRVQTFATNVSVRMLSILKNKVFRTRRRAYISRRMVREMQEEEEQAKLLLSFSSGKKAPKGSLEARRLLMERDVRRMRHRVESINRRNFVCDRWGCHHRKFFSKQRYDMHMAQHAHRDAERLAEKMIRDQEFAVHCKEVAVAENTFVDRVRELSAQYRAITGDSQQSANQGSPSELRGDSDDDDDDDLSLPDDDDVGVGNERYDNIAGDHSPALEAAVGQEATGEGRETAKSTPVTKLIKYEPPEKPFSAMLHTRPLHALQYTPLYHLELMSRRGFIDVNTTVPLLQESTIVGTAAGCDLPVFFKGEFDPVSGAPIGDNRDAKTGPQKGEVVTGPYAIVSRVHCIISYIENAFTGKQELVVWDNSTAWGTYIISTNNAPTEAIRALMDGDDILDLQRDDDESLSDAADEDSEYEDEDKRESRRRSKNSATSRARLVPDRPSAGLTLSVGDLLCIGVYPRTHPSHPAPPRTLEPRKASKAAVVYRLRCAEMES